MKANYHCHTTRCMHAKGSDTDYVEAAIAGGFQVLGFSDHVPWPYASYISHTRMIVQRVPEYIASIKALKERYVGQISLHVGFEAEYFPRYRDHLHWLQDQGIDYMILGQHFIGSEEDHPYAPVECESDDGVLRYADSVCEALQTGLYRYVCHPDIYMANRVPGSFNKACERAADMMCQAAIETHTLLEYNLLGQFQRRPYPCMPFWEYIRKHPVDVILGVDAHAPEMLTNTENYDLGKKRLHDLGFQPVEALDGLT